MKANKSQLISQAHKVQNVWSWVRLREGDLAPSLRDELTRLIDRLSALIDRPH